MDPLDAAAMIEAVDRCEVIWLDAISNPGLDVPELDLILAVARRSGTTSVVDSTLATPILLRPLELGADLVLHSATKYIGGHSDLMLGARSPAIRDLPSAFASVETSPDPCRERWKPGSDCAGCGPWGCGCNAEPRPLRSSPTDSPRTAASRPCVTQAWRPTLPTRGASPGCSTAPAR